MIVGYMWIVVGIIAGAFSLFAIPHGFRLLDQQKQVSPTVETNIQGDFFNGNKTVIENQVNVNAIGVIPNDNKISVAKLKINRAFKDFNSAIQNISEDFPKESARIAGQYNLRGMLTSGGFVQAQMDLSIKTKRRLDKEFENLNRGVEDILVEILGKPSLQSAGPEFNEEQNRINEAEKRCRDIYPLLNENPKSWEMKALREIRLTKDFDVANDNKN